MSPEERAYALCSCGQPSRKLRHRRWSPAEVAEALRLYREERLSYQQIGKRLGRNYSSVGYVVRREDLREEARLIAEETRN